MSITVSEFSFKSSSGICDIGVTAWIPEEPKAVLQISHGMAEHIDRYDDFARFLADNGVMVIGNDHLGHGRSIKDAAHTGFFAEKDGWERVLEDLRLTREQAKQLCPDAPYILMGHSMGSFLARCYCTRWPNDMDALIFSGTAGTNPVLGIARAMAKADVKKHGAMFVDEKINKLGFGSYNKKFAGRTAFDWLSTDDAQVDKYVADPLCGFTFTASAFYDLFGGLLEIQSPDWAAKVPKVTVLVYAGDMDPVGNYGKGPTEVAKKLTETGHNVTFKLYAGKRHETLNETNKEEVYKFVLDFLKAQFK